MHGCNGIRGVGGKFKLGGGARVSGALLDINPKGHTQILIYIWILFDYIEYFL